MEKTYHSIIIGAGFSGISAAIDLQKNKFDDFLILEKGDDFGGCWRQNTYPGAACDVPSDLYSLSYEPNTNWSESYSNQKDILDYVKNVAKKHNLYHKIKFHTKITKLKFDIIKAIWLAKTDSGEVYQSKFIVIGMGPLEVPVYPDIKGINNFQGASFHSSRWDHTVDIENKNVAIIGTGASAIQVLPAIANKVKNVTVYQRTATWVVRRIEKKLSPTSIEQRTKFPILQKMNRLMIFMLQEFSHSIMSNPNGILSKLAAKHVINRIKSNVKDPETAKKLIPNYTIGCKRILASNNYYSTFNQKNVHLNIAGISEITSNGIIDNDGKETPVDIIVYCTGFDPKGTKNLFDVAIKRKKQTDAQPTVPQSYKGITITGVPNLFYILGSNSGLGHNSVLYMIEAQTKYMVRLMQIVQHKNADMFEVKQNIFVEYNKNLHKKLKNTVWQKGSCVSWYQTEEGINYTLWPGNCLSYGRMMKRNDEDSYTFTRLSDDSLSDQPKNPLKT
jgi:cation diffusion facilitator CzcD-associated flavoprotein CzcO